MLNFDMNQILRPYDFVLPENVTVTYSSELFNQLTIITDVIQRDEVNLGERLRYWLESTKVDVSSIQLLRYYTGKENRLEGEWKQIIYEDGKAEQDELALDLLEKILKRDTNVGKHARFELEMYFDFTTTSPGVGYHKVNVKVTTFLHNGIPYFKFTNEYIPL